MWTGKIGQALPMGVIPKIGGCTSTGVPPARNRLCLCVCPAASAICLCEHASLGGYRENKAPVLATLNVGASAE